MIMLQSKVTAKVRKYLKSMLSDSYMTWDLMQESVI